MAIVYGNVLQRCKETLRYLPILLTAGIGYALLEIVTGFIVSRMFFLPGGRIISGLLRWFIQLAILSHFAALFLRLKQRGSLLWEDLLRFDLSFVGPLSRVFFVFYLIEMLLSRFPVSPSGLILLALWSLFILPAYEMIYLGNVRDMAVFSELFEYWKVNGLALALFFIPYYYLFTFAGVPGLIFLQGLFYWIRGFLFEETYFSNPRSRAFRRGVGR